MQDITKFCSDNLRLFSKNYGIKLKASHAHELVAACFGYKSRAAMLADKQCPISNLSQAEVIVMASDDFLDQRRKQLAGLSPELPDNYTLGKPFYESLFASKLWTSPYPPFKSFEKLARYLFENDASYKKAFIVYRKLQLHHIVKVQKEENGVTLTVLHAHKVLTGELIGYGQTTIKLKRVAGHIGYGIHQIHVEQWTGGARKALGFMGGQ